MGCGGHVETQARATDAAAEGASGSAGTAGTAGTAGKGGSGGTGGSAGSGGTAGTAGKGGTAGDGGGMDGGKCVPTDKNDPCNVCANAKCCDEIVACGTSAGCVNGFVCFLSSDAGDWAARQMACMKPGDPGDWELNDLIACVYDPKNGKCGVVCS
jgi:hypothetical protein